MAGWNKAAPSCQATRRERSEHYELGKQSVETQSLAYARHHSVPRLQSAASIQWLGRQVGANPDRYGPHAERSRRSNRGGPVHLGALGTRRAGTYGYLCGACNALPDRRRGKVRADSCPDGLSPKFLIRQLPCATQVPLAKLRSPAPCSLRGQIPHPMKMGYRDLRSEPQGEGQAIREICTVLCTYRLGVSSNHQTNIAAPLAFSSAARMMTCAQA